MNFSKFNPLFSRSTFILLTIFLFFISPIHSSLASQNYLEKIIFDEVLFNKNIKWVEENSKKIDKKIYGGVVPHHNIAGDIIADFFYNLSMSKPKIIILISPNHFEKGSHHILLSDMIWQIQTRQLHPNKTIIDSIQETNKIVIDNNTVSNDHGITTLLPFIAYYIPDTTIVPIIVSKKTNSKEIDDLVEKTLKFYKEDIVIVASVDFSHYLSASQSEKKDFETLNTIQNHDYRALFLYNNDHIDSPASVAYVMKMMEKVGANDMTILNHTNSSKIFLKENSEVTSYYSFIYYRNYKEPIRKEDIDQSLLEKVINLVQKESYLNLFKNIFK